METFALEDSQADLQITLAGDSTRINLDLCMWRGPAPALGRLRPCHPESSLEQIKRGTDVSSGMASSQNLGTAD